MKKILFALIAFFAISARTTAQESGNMLPDKGSIGVELFTSEVKKNGKFNPIDGIKLRYFVTNKDVIRLDLGFNVSRDKYKEDDYTMKYRQGNFRMDFGYERHFNIHKRLDLYVGGEFGFRKDFSHYNDDEDDGDYYAPKYISWDDDDFDDDFDDEDLFEDLEDEYRNMPGTSIRLGAFAGLDFYIWKGLYVGAEFEFGMTNKKIEDEKLHFTTGGFFKPTFRIGYTF